MPARGRETVWDRYSLREKGGERLNVEVDARAVQGAQIARAIFDAHHGPRVATRREHRIHQKAGHSSVAIHVWMDVPKEPVSEHRSNRWLVLCRRGKETRQALWKQILLLAHQFQAAGTVSCFRIEQKSAGGAHIRRVSCLLKDSIALAYRFMQAALLLETQLSCIHDSIILPASRTDNARNHVTKIQDVASGSWTSYDEVLNERPRNSIDIGELIDSGPWATPQNVTLGLACFIVICDGFDNLVFGLAIPAVSRGLLASPKDFGIVLAFSFIGLSVGTIYAGRLGDRYGRKPILLGSLLLFGLFTAALSFAHSIMDLSVLRFLAGIGLGGAIPNVTALVSECSPARHRALAVTLTAISMTVGGMVGAGAASWILPTFGWRYLFAVAGFIPLVALPFLYFLLPESAKYLAGNPLNRERLLRVLERLRVVYPKERPITRNEEVSSEAVDARMLFNSSFLRDTLALWVTFFFAMAAGYMLLNWIPTILAKAGFSLRQSSLGLLIYSFGGIFGAMIAALTVRYFSSRVVVYFCMGAVTVALFAGAGPAFANTSVALAFAVLFFLGLFVIATSSSIFAIASNVYPTSLRSSGVGYAVAFGRLGAIGSSFLGAAMAGAVGGSRTSFQVAAALLAGQSIAMLFLTRHVPRVAGMQA